MRGLAAHAAAEARVLRFALHTSPRREDLEFFVAQVFAAHTAQERELVRIARSVRGLDAGTDRVRYMLEQHARQEQALTAALTECLPPSTQQQMAADYATERLRLLVSAPSFTLVSDAR